MNKSGVKKGIKNCPLLVVAGAHSGSGKTSLTIALAGALCRRGYKVQTFKVGPDFLDPTYLALVSGRPCYNLDSWMMDRQQVQNLFARATADADVALIEGVMGLFDGASPTTSEGSTAEIACWLNAPVLLIVNSRGMSRSFAAVVKGLTSFEPELNIMGIIANHCGSSNHAKWLSASLQAAGQPPLLGAIPRNGFVQIPARHLGLVSANERNLTKSVIDDLSDTVKRHVSIETLLQYLQVKKSSAGPTPEITSQRLCEEEKRPKQSRNQLLTSGLPHALSCIRNDKRGSRPSCSIGNIRIGVAYDEAFHFYYQDLFDALLKRGCEIVRFSPLADSQLPDKIHGLYIGGGYPEVYAKALSGNKNMLSSIRSFAGSGRPVYAECGGLMYLSRGIEMSDGQRYALLDILPSWTKMSDRQKALGYVEAKLGCDSLWGKKGDVIRGHEFHYSELIDDPCVDKQWNTVYQLQKPQTADVRAEGFQKGNILASYVHLYHAAKLQAVDSFIENCKG